MVLEKVTEYILKNKLLSNGDSVVLGISGGADSICMLNLLSDLRGRLGLSLFGIHVNHHIRGEEALRDQKFVEDMCKKLDVELKVVDANVETIASKQKISVEEAGRKVRYQAMIDLCLEKNAKKIAVAHNLDDNSETVLFNLFRGTGVKGMSGIPKKRLLKNGLAIIRPLLGVSRKEITDYMSEKGIAYCDDSTNEETKYTRNKIRLELIPYVTENINSDAKSHITEFSEDMSKIALYLDNEVAKAYEDYVDGWVIKDDAISLDSIILSGIVRKMIREKVDTLKDVTRTHINSVVDLFRLQVGKVIELPYNLVFVRTYEGIKLKAKSEKVKGMAKKEVADWLTITENVTDIDRDNIPDLPYTKWLDYDRIERLELRHRNYGDYIVIDANGGKKKLKDYFIDAKIPREFRDKVWLVADHSHVLWIVGHRISEDCKVKPTTRNIVRLDFDMNKKYENEE